MRKIIFFIIFILFANCKNNEERKPKVNSEINSAKSQKKEIQIDYKVTKTENAENKKIDTVEINTDAIQKATIDINDSTIWLTANMRLDHRIFGYEKPNTNSKKLFLLSIFTNEVKNNPFNCKYGAFYETNDMVNIKLKFIENIGSYGKIEIITPNKSEIAYIEKKWIQFDNEE